MLENIPKRLLVLSPDDRMAVVAAQAAMRSLLDGGPTAHIGRLPPWGDSPPRLVWRVLKKCPDELADPKSKILDFVKDDELRESIELDISSAHSALANDELKAATVMAGAAIEALLLWALQDGRVFPKLMTFGAKPPLAISDLEKSAWGLDGYIKAAAHAGLLDDDTRKGLELAQNYRNLIHAGRAARLGATCNRGTAHSAVGALESLIVKLRGQLP